MRNFYVITIALASSLSPCFAQDSFQQRHQRDVEYLNQARMKRQLDKANSELDDVNSRLEEIEREKRDIERKAEEAEKERLLNLPLDADITPLQGRYLESVTDNVSDPKLRSQLYDKVRATFGGIQQSRDIQGTTVQEEDGSMALELHRAQLDNSRMELGLARDRVLQQQEVTAKTQEFNTALEDFQNYELPDLSPEEARSRVNLLAAQYSDVIAAVPAAKAKLDLFNNAFESTRRSSELTAGFIGNAATLVPDEAERISPGITSTPQWQEARNVHVQKEQNAEAKKQFQVDLAIVAGAATAATGLVEILKEENLVYTFDEVDQQLRDLDADGYVTPELKTKLREKGIYALETTEVPLEEKTGKYSGPNKVKQTEQIALLKQVARAALSQASRKSIELAKNPPKE